MRLVILFVLCVALASGSKRILREEAGESIGPVCGLCLGTVGLLEQSYRLLPTTLVRNLLEAACIRKSNFQSYLAKNKNLCAPVSEQLTPIILYSVWKRVFSPKRVCGDIGMCKPFYKKMNLTEEIHRIVDSRPAEPVQPKSTETIKILHLSDIHLDTQYLEGYSNTCDDIICCHKENGVAPNSSLAAGFFGDYKCDTPIPLLDQAVRFIKKTHPDIKALLVTGDMSAHNEWSKSIQSNNYITNLVAEKLSTLSPEIVFALGNNECFPDHQFDPQHESALKTGIAKAFQNYLSEEESLSLKENGYYARRIKGLNLKIVSLNSEMCDNMNFYLVANVTDPSSQLEWLEAQLADSEAKREGVYITSHISPNLLECSTIWSEVYRALIARYNFTIKGQFYGHTHNDMFVVYTHSLTKQPTSLLLQSPSLSPIMSHQPAFRIYEIDPTNMRVRNFIQYSTDLIDANKHRGQEIDWKVSYNFTREYNLPEFSVASVSNLRDRMANDSDLLTKYRSHLTGGTGSSYDLHALYCQTFDAHSQVYRCMNQTAGSDSMTYFTELLQGPWYKRIHNTQQH